MDTDKCKKCQGAGCHSVMDGMMVLNCTACGGTGKQPQKP